ncbi:MAG: TonB-dependent receptor [Sphingobium sp.]|uniref:TonB-dependent receptor n=1 Tax=Sphingobium sp. TaxID=1912891 RepID=UPI0029B486AC|nr:TonB-dependent receptor [Sphingobium sp.]MDX3908406.1 TonB-dependent receptor [Sphingobium sp.]
MFSITPPGHAPSRVKSRRLSWLVASLLLSCAPTAYAQAPADAALDAAAEADAGGIVVTARNREEDINDVPIPISVLSGETLAQQRVFNIADLAQRAPGLTATSPNARRTGVSLRGIGKTSGNDNMEAAVGTIVDDVFLGHVGMTYQDFTDLQQVEVLRGPQGTLLGKNTSLGVIKYTSKAPSFTPEGSFDIEGGLSTPSVKVRGSYSSALIDDVLAFRASFFYDRQQGDISNVNPSRGRHWHERNRWGGRFQLLYKPTETLSVKLNVDGAETNENSNTKPFMVDPTTLNDGSVRGTTYTTRLSRGYFGGYTPIIGSWTKIDIDQALPLITRNYGASVVATWDAGPLEIKSISAIRKLHFDANNDSEQTRFAINRGGTLVDTEQLSQEFRVSGDVGSAIKYQGGVYLYRIATETTSRTLFGTDAGAFYATNAQYQALNNPAGFILLQNSLRNVRSTTYQKPISTSQAVFAQIDWNPIDILTITGGLRYTREQKRSRTSKAAAFADGAALVSTGSAPADAIRNGQLGNSYTDVIGDPIHDDSIAWLINPSLKITDTFLFYGSASGGGKSGAVAFGNDGSRRNIAPEKTTDFELGIKGAFFHDVLSLSLNLYHTKVRDYQATTNVPDATSSTGFSSVLGNIPGIRARGVEWEGALRPLQGVTFTFGGAYNDAKYTDWSNATCPRSFPASVASCNNSGKQIVGAPRWTVNLGADFERELGNSGVTLHLFANDVYRSSHNLEQLLSPYGFQKAYHLTDAGIGFGAPIKGVETELSIVAKNLFNTFYTTSINDFSNNAPVGYDGIGPRRYIGALLRAKF